MQSFPMAYLLLYIAAGRPYDGVPDMVTVAVSVVQTVVFSLLAAAGIVFAVVCLIFNFIFRNRKLVITVIVLSVPKRFKDSLVYL